MNAPLSTVLIGFGKMAAGYAADLLMAKHYPFSAHAQVLSAHPDFSWAAVVDPSEEALRQARDQWHVPVAVPSVAELPSSCLPEIAVLATPPTVRLQLVDALPSLRGVLVEKPLGVDLQSAETFTACMRDRSITVQVNLWRRCDRTFRYLADGGLKQAIGKVQGVFCAYGNGLRNNGTHMIDFVRMLVGEVISVQTVPGSVSFHEGPLSEDVNVPFSITCDGGVVAFFQPLRFSSYRENSLELWGEKGCLRIVQEGLSINLYKSRANRASQNEREIDFDTPDALESTVGSALYDVYDDLATALNKGIQTASPAESAMRTTNVVEAVFTSLAAGDAPISLSGKHG